MESKGRKLEEGLNSRGRITLSNKEVLSGLISARGRGLGTRRFPGPQVQRCWR